MDASREHDVLIPVGGDRLGVAECDRIPRAMRRLYELVMNWPYGRWKEDSDSDSCSEPIGRCLAEHGIPFQDLPDVLSEREKRQAPRPKMNSHPNADGHRLIAQQLSR